VPAEERASVRLDDTALQAELLRMTDAFTNELFPPTPVEACRVVFPVSRLICDVERFPSDEDEPMAGRGMGVVYTHMSTGDTLKAPPDRQLGKPSWTGGTGRIMSRWSAR